jgi:hypothetical protein
MEYITQDVIAYLMNEQPLDIAEAMRQFYTSKTYEKLLDEETGLYLESSAYIYDLFKDECKNGEFIQNEI